MSAVKGNFGEGNVTKLIIRLALPLMAAEVVHVLYNIVDRIFIGHLPGVGTAALTGVGIALPLITLIGAFANLFSTGGSTIAAIARGEGDNKKSQDVTETCFTLAIVIGFILTIVMYAFAPQLLSAMGGDEETLPYAISYFRIYVLGCIPVEISLGMNTFITGQGFATTGMLTVIIGAALNTALDPLLMYVFDMGIEGAAIATVISQTVSAAWIVLFFLSKKPVIPIRRLHIDKEYMVEVVKLGVTGFTFKATTSVTQGIVNATLKMYGGALSTLYVGAMSVINSLREVATIPINGAGSGFVPVASFNYGAKKWDRLDESIKVAMIMFFSLNIILWIFLFFMPGTLAGLFTEDASLIDITAKCTKVYFSMFLFMSLQVIGQNTFVALNYPKYALFFSFLRKIFVILPLTLILPKIGMGVMGVFYAEAVSNVIGGIAAFTTMYKVIWSKIKKKARGDETIEV